MDGTEHGLDDPFASHQCCRCCPVPLLRDRETPPRETGAEWFANQDAATQRAMLGPGKQQLYAEGKLTLADLVGERHDPTWGKSRYQRSLREIQAGTHTPSRSSGSGGAGVPPQTVATLPHPIPQSLGAAADPRAQLWAMRANQLAAMTDAELRAEIAVAQQAQWKPTRLIAHAKDHRRDFVQFLDGPLNPNQLEELSRIVVHSWDRLFTEIDDEMVSYLFLARWKQSDATMVVSISRGGVMRTCFPIARIEQWIDRNPALVEITDRGNT